jgi:hypothetical protein
MIEEVRNAAYDRELNVWIASGGVRHVEEMSSTVAARNAMDTPIPPVL